MIDEDIRIIGSIINNTDIRKDYNENEICLIIKEANKKYEQSCLSKVVNDIDKKIDDITIINDKYCDRDYGNDNEFDNEIDNDIEMKDLTYISTSMNDNKSESDFVIKKKKDDKKLLITKKINTNELCELISQAYIEKTPSQNIISNEIKKRYNKNLVNIDY